MGIRSAVRGFVSTVVVGKMLPGAQRVVKWGAEQVASRLRDGVDLSDKVYSPPGSAQGTAGGIPSRLEVTPPQPGEKKVPKIPTEALEVSPQTGLKGEDLPQTPPSAQTRPAVKAAAAKTAPSNPPVFAASQPNVRVATGRSFALFERIWLQEGDARFPGEIYARHDDTAGGSVPSYDVLISHADGHPRLVLGQDGTQLSSRHSAQPLASA